VAGVDVSNVEDVGVGVDVGASVNAGGQGSQVPECHIELCEGCGAVGK
jgi:hypothetical protein